MNSPIISDQSLTRRAGFTLTELLTVLTVMGIVMAFSVPHMISLTSGASLQKDGKTLITDLGEARQLAMSRSTDIEVRFYENPNAGADQESSFIGYQLFQYPASGVGAASDPSGMIPVRPMRRFSDGSGVNTGLSTLLDRALAASDAAALGSGLTAPEFGEAEVKISSGGASESLEFISFRFTGNGGTNLSSLTEAGETWHITLVDSVAAESLSAGELRDFYTVQVNPLNGAVRVFEPLP